MRKIVCHIVNALIFSYVVLMAIANGTPCYSKAQTVCQNRLNPFWVAVIKRDNSNICVHLQPVYDCIIEYKASCGFDPEDEELFESDIIQVYTKSPFNCPLSRTRAMQGAPHKADRNQATTAVLSPLISLFCTLTSCLVTLSYLPHFL